MSHNPKSIHMVYILTDERNKLYVGQTANLDHRIEQHSRGACASTAHFTAHKVLHYFLVPTRYAALKLEVYLQRLQRTTGNRDLLDIVTDCPHLSDAIWKEALGAPDTAYQLQFK